MKLTVLEKLFNQNPSLEDVIRDTILKRKNDDAFCVCDTSDIVRKHKNWLMKLPRVRPFYAVKCNPSPIVLEILSALGVGFDCASKAEIDAVLDLGVSPNDVIYANPCKSKPYISHAASLGVDYMTFDNEEELYKVRQFHPNAKMVLRIKVDDSKSVFRLSLKFGAAMRQVPKLLKVAKSIGVNVVGCSFHVGSGCGSTDSFRQAIADARVVFDMGEQVGFDMKILDLGGGYPGSNRALISFDETAIAINESLAIHFPEFDQAGNPNKIQIIAEPGRYYVASAFTMVTNILAKRVDEPEDNEVFPMDQSLIDSVAISGAQSTSQSMTMYYLNDGVYGSFNCVLCENEPLKPIAFPLHGSFENRPYRLCTLWGPTCDSIDCLMRNAVLPDLEIGEWIAFPDMGAYSICLGTSFNGFHMPELKYYLPTYTLDLLQALRGWSRIFRTIEQSDEDNFMIEEDDSLLQTFFADNNNRNNRHNNNSNNGRFIPVR